MMIDFFFFLPLDLKSCEGGVRTRPGCRLSPAAPSESSARRVRVPPTKHAHTPLEIPRLSSKFPPQWCYRELYIDALKWPALQKPHVLFLFLFLRSPPPVDRPAAAPPCIPGPARESICNRRVSICALERRNFFL